ncbi:hypothetical protein [Streptomyces sp. NPDC003077]|uniref:hypothetical protein n=1 Tax=Streptomyces sp. NPDC003077 TaxID=3154443 RepID=UPI0033AB3198
MDKTAGQDPGHSDATRLLCVAAYVDAAFRRQVIEELVEHEERPVAPSIGCDIVPVLAHALRARRGEALAGLGAAVVWGGFAAAAAHYAADGYGVRGTALAAIVYASASAVMWQERSLVQGHGVYDWGRAARNRGRPPAGPYRLGRLLPVLPRAVLLWYWAVTVTLVVRPEARWSALVFPLVLVVPVATHQVWVDRVLRKELSREAFARAGRRPLPDTRRYRRLREAIDREQFSPLAVYAPARPLVGFGLTYDAWSFALELEPKKRQEDGTAPAAPARLTNREVLDLIRPQVAGLRAPGAVPGRDRLRQLRVDEFVCLPARTARDMATSAGGVGRNARDPALREPDRLRETLRRAVDDDGEGRRHFLRVRVDSWDGQLMVTVLVRVHTQGGMLVLEVTPFVLPPVREHYEVLADAASRRGREPVGAALRALASGPASSFAALLALPLTVAVSCRTWLSRPAHEPPDGPLLSVRELGSAEQVTLFHEMDVSRYVKTVQDRIAHGVLEVLRAKGYDTGEFEQQIVNVERGGIFVGAMSGGVASTGERATITQQGGEHRGRGGRS